MPAPELEFDPAIADRICERVANGQSLRLIAADEEMPSRSTIYKWLDEQQTFASHYARAREDQADFYADEIIEIADTEKDPAVARVRTDARKWVASKLKPKRYGERIEQHHSGSIGLGSALDQLPDG